MNAVNLTQRTVPEVVKSLYQLPLAEELAQEGEFRQDLLRKYIVKWARVAFRPQCTSSIAEKGTFVPHQRVAAAAQRHLS